MAGGANVILIPERPFQSRKCPGSLSGDSPATMPPSSWSRRARCRSKARCRPGREVDAFGHERLAGIGTFLEEEIARRTGKEARATVLGHVQRGGSPTAFDRVLATRFGLHAVDALHDGHSGQMVALHGTAIELVPLTEATAVLKLVSPELFAEAEVFFG